jgi:hypothetical protein
MGGEFTTTPIPTFPLRGKEISSLPNVISLPLRGRVRVGVLLIEGTPLE